MIVTMTASTSSRSRHGSQSSSRSHWSRASTKRKPAKLDEDGRMAEGMAGKPELDELRKRRTEYYDVPLQEHKKETTSYTTKSGAMNETRTRSQSSKTGSEKSRKSSKRKTSVRSAERRKSDDYVYKTGSASSSTRPKNRSGRSSPPRRHSPPTALALEVTPDDSISQVGTKSKPRPTNKLIRPSPKRSNTYARLAPITENDSDVQSSSTVRPPIKRQSLLGSLFGRRNTAPAIPAPPRLVECLTCGCDVPAAQSAKLKCGHRMCNDCLKRIFEMSVKDPEHMPPKCCTDIPLQHVDKLFDVKFKLLWNRKYQEYHTQNRIYCPASKCGEWIKSPRLHSYQGREFVQCPRCGTKVCMSCNGKMHKSRECPNDPELASLLAHAKEKGWQTCFSCNAMVELKEGCNHMRCRCTAEFCMICGSKWKTCDCSWFNYVQPSDGDRLLNMRVAEPILARFRASDDSSGEGNTESSQLSRERRRRTTYTEEIDARRRQERTDEELARRMQLADLTGLDDSRQARQRVEVETWGLGNAAGHFMNDDFVQNASNVVMSAFGDTKMGRRGERESGRRRRPRVMAPEVEDSGLVPNFLGDQSVLGVGPAMPRASRYSR